MLYESKTCPILKEKVGFGHQNHRLSGNHCVYIWCDSTVAVEVKQALLHMTSPKHEKRTKNSPKSGCKCGRGVNDGVVISAILRFICRHFDTNALFKCSA